MFQFIKTADRMEALKLCINVGNNQERYVRGWCSGREVEKEGRVEGVVCWEWRGGWFAHTNPAKPTGRLGESYSERHPNLEPRNEMSFDAKRDFSLSELHLPLKKTSSIQNLTYRAVTDQDFSRNGTAGVTPFTLMVARPQAQLPSHKPRLLATRNLSARLAV